MIHHSEHGAQYTAPASSQRLEQAGVLRLMGTVRDALDNAMAETFFATLQTQLLDRGRWPTRKILASAIFSYIETFYHRKRRHSALGYRNPGEYERLMANTDLQQSPDQHRVVAT